MASDKDVLDKADALLRRHAASSGVGSDTGGVPVLTDIIGGPSAEKPGAELAADVFNHVMAEVERRLAADLEHRLVQRLTPQVHAAVSGAIADLRQELANAIADAVAEAFARRKVK